MATAINNDFILRAGLVVQGTATVTSSTSQVGAAQINSGLAVAKNAYIGTNLYVGGDIDLRGALTSTGTATFASIQVAGLAQFNGNVVTSGTSYVYGALTAASDINALSNVQIAGGLTATQATNLLGGLTVLGTSTLSGRTNVNGPLTVDGSVVVTGTNSVLVGTGTVELGGTLTVDGIATFNDSTAAGVNATGALVLPNGGAYIGNNLFISGTGWNTGTNFSNALYVNGGAWVKESLVVEGPVLFKDGVTFSGTATYVLSTNTYYTDNLIDLHTPPGGVDVPWTLDDGKDIGIVYHYYKGADKRAFLGLANDTGYLEWYSEGLESGSVFTGTVYGTIKTGAIQLVNTSEATSSVTGALQVAGGIGVGGNVYSENEISGKSLFARNLGENRLVIVGTNSRLSESEFLTWNSSLNQIEGRIAYANTASLASTATNLSGGAAGSLVYQTAPNTTGFISIGASGYILQSNGTNPVWGPAVGIVAGSANTATNIAGGDTNQIPYQSSTGTTVFSSNLTFDGTTFTTTNIAVSGTTDTSGNATSGALRVAGGVGIAKSLWVGNSATIAGSLYVDGDIFLQGAGLNTLNAQTGTFQYVVVNGTTGTGLSVTGDAVINRNLKVSGVSTFSNFVATAGTVTTLTATNAFVTGLTVTGVSSLQGVTASVLTATTVNATTLNVTGQSTLQNLTAAVTTVTTLTVTGSETVQGNLGVTGVSTFTGKILVNDTTQASAVNVGSIVTLGGVGIAKDLQVGGSITVGSATANTVVPAVLSNNVLLSSFTSNAISGTATQNLDTFSAATYRTARYLVQVVDGPAVHVSEMTVFHDGTNVYLNEYGISTIPAYGQLGEFDAQLAAGSVTLKFTPAAATAMTIKVVRIGITA